MARYAIAHMLILLVKFLCMAFLTGTASASLDCAATEMKSCPRGKSMMQVSTASVPQFPMRREIAEPFLGKNLPQFSMRHEIAEPFLGKNLKIYVQGAAPDTCDLLNFTMFRNRSNQRNLSKQLSFENAFSGDIDEYSFGLYIANRAVCDGDLFVPTSDPSEADLCFTSCASGGPTNYQNDLVLEIGSTSKLRDMFGCEQLKFGPEIAFGAQNSNDPWVHKNCTFAAPYMHAYSIRKDLRSDLNYERPTLLVFIGGSWRGARGVLDDLQMYSNETFYAPRIFENHGDEQKSWRKKSFYKEIHQTYTRGTFSLHPGGDSPTRSAFFQSWVHGCIPVVGQGESEVYRPLEISLLQGRTLEEYIVVANTTNASALVQTLRNIPPSVVRMMRMNLLATASLMQWGYQSHKDPLSHILFFKEKEFIAAKASKNASEA